MVCQHYWPESFGVNAICDEFVERGWDVDILCGIPNYPEGRFYSGYSWFHNRRQRHKGVRVIRCVEVPRGGNTNLRILLNYVSFPISSLAAVPRLLGRRYDAVFIYQLSPVLMAIAGLLVGTIGRVPTSMYVLDLWPENLYSVLPVRSSSMRRLAAAISHWHYRRADALIALTETMKSKLLAVSGLPEDRVLVLPQSCDPIYETDLDASDLRERFSNGFNIVFAGNISPAQDFPTIVKAARILRDQGQVAIDWIIVGDGMSRRDFEAQVQIAGLSDQFYFEGFKEPKEVVRYHGIADALIAGLADSDLLEVTIPAKVMSYIAAGRPVILAMNGEGPALVRTIGCGLAGPAGDPIELARNVRTLIEMSDSEREQMGRRGREYHLAHLQRSRGFDKLFAFLSTVR